MLKSFVWAIAKFGFCPHEDEGESLLFVWLMTIDDKDLSSRWFKGDIVRTNMLSAYSLPKQSADNPEDVLIYDISYRTSAICLTYTTKVTLILKKKELICPLLNFSKKYKDTG